MGSLGHTPRERNIITGRLAPVVPERETLRVCSGVNVGLSVPEDDSGSGQVKTGVMEAPVDYELQQQVTGKADVPLSVVYQGCFHDGEFFSKDLEGGTKVFQVSMRGEI